MRNEVLLNDGWHFHKGDIPQKFIPDKGPIYSQSKLERKLQGPAAYKYFDRIDPYSAPCELTNDGWKVVTLPHDYVVQQDLDRNENCALGYLHYDKAWYRRYFKLPEDGEGKRITLRFDGVTGNSVIYVNGCLMAHNYSTYNTFEVDISDVVYFDKDNVVAVFVDPTGFEGWWYQGGGIYRDVYLTITEPVAIDLYGVYAPYKKLDGDRWQLDYETTVLNTSYEDVKVKAITKLIDKNGDCVCVAEGEGEIPLRDSTVLKYSAVVENPLLWDCDNPNLYSVETELYLNGEVIDNNKTRIGFRTIEFTVDKGMLLNGKPTFINGLCGHQDFGLTGLAVPDNICRYKVKLMKEMGANGYRTSHYQYTTAYMDAFDEMGFLVMDEARWFESTEEGKNQLESLLKRDRNRPCVIFWSTSNEEPHHCTPLGKRVHKAITAHIRKFDKTRPVVAAVSNDPDKCKIYDDCELVGINYNTWLYDKVHEMYPEKPIFASEFAATGTTRDWNFMDSSSNRRIRDYDKDVNNWFQGRENSWKIIKSKPFVFGAFQWTAVEHRGETVWPGMCSCSGAIDIFLQKKGAFYQNKSYWTDEPMAHIVPHWNFAGLEGQEVPVTVYTNCDELELFLNGKSLGKKQIPLYERGEWNVVYEAGELKVIGYKNGKPACEDIRVTTGKPVALNLRLENEFKNDGIELALFTCECLDEEGRVVPDAAEYVTFSVSNPAVIVGTGSDNTDPLNVTNPSRQMFMGKISVAVRPKKDQESFELVAQAKNLKTKIIKINCK
ncbi:MAG: DUF4982 domain-containing protein [Clostridia bacterium]|nr:DUF4982 domain-containing protein [Clostridia bacterium]